ncbi:hypothetical protein B488_05420 [Liberibacter crescens BT-1]|uniref:Uncharacterized protein n=1 Tax=Liberibacter crescens (strain BT-1) TaxID=1215343 RepID=L0ESQ9_LIBCB|nr:hypothetical protein B488_05420 [Liberibacter crescens BT-1]
MNFIAPWKEIRFRFNSPTFWRINLLATLNGLFFASLNVSFAGTLYIFITLDMTETGNLLLLQGFILSLIFFLFYVGMNANRWATIVYYTLFILLLIAYPQLLTLRLLVFFAFLIGLFVYTMTVALFFIPVCFCNLFLNTNRWTTIVYYTLLTNFLMFCFLSFFQPLLSSMFTVIYSVFLPGAILGYNLWRHCLLYYTNLKDDDRERLPIIPSWEICRSMINVSRNLLVMVLVTGLIGGFAISLFDNILDRTKH